MLDGGMLQSGKGKNKAPARVCVCVCVIRCEVLGAALCSLKGPGCRPALCSSSTILHVSSSSPLIICPLCPFIHFSPPFLLLHALFSLQFFLFFFLVCTQPSKSQSYCKKTPLCNGAADKRKVGNEGGGGHLSSRMSI